MSLSELPSYAFECKKLSDDGAFWPAARAEMRHPRAIPERMAEDLRTLLQARGAGAVITTEDYLRLGWHREQVQRYGLAAAALLSENTCGNDHARDLANEVA